MAEREGFEYRHVQQVQARAIIVLSKVEALARCRPAFYSLTIMFRWNLSLDSSSPSTRVSESRDLGTGGCGLGLTNRAESRAGT
jgi:hypothetical protein